MTSANGTSLGVMKYDRFGECRESPSEIPTDRLFTGQRYDDTGLYYYNARYYDPELGRFISADTFVQLEPGVTSISSYLLTDVKMLQDQSINNYIYDSVPYNPQCLNRYSYVLNNPVIYIDDTGHVAWFLVAVVAVLLAEYIGFANTGSELFYPIYVDIRDDIRYKETIAKNVSSSDRSTSTRCPQILTYVQPRTVNKGSIVTDNNDVDFVDPTKSNTPVMPAVSTESKAPTLPVTNVNTTPPIPEVNPATGMTEEQLYWYLYFNGL